MAFMNEKSTAKLGYQNEFWSNVRNNTNGKKVLVIHDFVTACIMAKNNEVYYIKTNLMKIADLANERNAKLDYYKDVNDLLKAIYRSVSDENK